VFWRKMQHCAAPFKDYSWKTSFGVA
jgi:hypothetical protein